jgi:uncharacterized glyoxalase superfamily protein PhnB
MSTRSTVFHDVTYVDANAGMDFLRTLGFEERAVYRAEADASQVLHAEFAWHGLNVLMCTSASNARRRERVGKAACYLVVDDVTEVDDFYRRALDAGGSTCLEPHDPEYGGRTACVRDAEGNHFSIGTYPDQ